MCTSTPRQIEVLRIIEYFDGESFLGGAIRRAAKQLRSRTTDRAQAASTSSQPGYAMHVRPDLRQRAPRPLNTLIDKGQALGAKGRDVVPFSVGEPDHQPPEAAVEAMRKAAGEGRFPYQPLMGCPPLREAIAARLSTEHGQDYSEPNVLMTTGGLQAIANAFRASLAPGDEVVLFSPY